MSDDQLQWKWFVALLMKRQRDGWQRPRQPTQLTLHSIFLFSQQHFLTSKSTKPSFISIKVSFSPPPETFLSSDKWWKANKFNWNVEELKFYFYKKRNELEMSNALIDWFVKWKSSDGIQGQLSEDLSVNKCCCSVRKTIDRLCWKWDRQEDSAFHRRWKDTNKRHWPVIEGLLFQQIFPPFWFRFASSHLKTMQRICRKSPTDGKSRRCRICSKYFLKVQSEIRDFHQTFAKHCSIEKNFSLRNKSHPMKKKFFFHSCEGENVGRLTNVVCLHWNSMKGRLLIMRSESNESFAQSFDTIGLFDKTNNWRKSLWQEKFSFHQIGFCSSMWHDERFVYNDIATFSASSKF